MKCTTVIGGKLYTFDTANAMDISIPLQFDGDQPRMYGVPKATARAYEDGKFVGDTRRGGGCNFDEIRLVTHCNGTHTECVGHISKERIFVVNMLQGALIPTTLVTVFPENASSTTESYMPPKQPADQLITARQLGNALNDCDPEFLRGLIVRTLPNDGMKQSRDYAEYEPPYFSREAVEYLVERRIEHLVVDLPSIDRKFDEGRLSSHHVFWGVPQGSHAIDPLSCSTKTITELVYVNDEIPDGQYLLNLNIPSFRSDAAPSRPLIYPVSGTS